MNTYRECVYIVFDELNLSSDDSRWEVEHIIYLLNKYRAILTKQRYGGPKKDVPLEYYQILDLGQPKLPYTSSNERKVFSFEQEIPSILNLHGMLLETSLSYRTEPIAQDCIVCGVPIVFYDQRTDYIENIDVAIVNPDRFKYLGHNKWLAKMAYATIGYNHKLYLSSSRNFLSNKWFQLQAIFENPTDFVQSTEDKLDMYFPVEQALVQPIIDLVIKELSNILYLPGDRVNNSSDDQETSLQTYTPSKIKSNTTVE